MKTVIKKYLVVCIGLSSFLSVFSAQQPEAFTLIIKNFTEPATVSYLPAPNRNIPKDNWHNLSYVRILIPSNYEVTISMRMPLTQTPHVFIGFQNIPEETLVFLPRDLPHRTITLRKCFQISANDGAVLASKNIFS